MAESKTQADIKDIESDMSNPIEVAIYKHYSPNTQAQDLMWTNYFRTELVAQGEADVEQKVVGMVLAVQGGKSVDEALSGIDDDKKEAYKKLVKVGIRTAWAKACITEGLTAMAESREPNYPPFPAV